jgi:hypothetical protein
MFTLQQTGRPGSFRLVAPDSLDADDFHSIADRLGQVPISAHKIGLVAARTADRNQRIETRWDGKESEILAESGDWIVTSLSPSGEVLLDSGGNPNTYSIKPGRFAELYEPMSAESPFGRIFRPKGQVEALRLSGGFEIMAPWGEMQRATDGYLLLNGDEVYGNNRQTFEETYQPIF